VATEGLCLNEIGEVSLTTSSPLIFDSYSENRATGAFILIDPITNFTSAVGMILGKDEAHDEVRQAMVSLSQMGFSYEERAIIERFCEELSRRYGIDIVLRT
jgi:sulfate adenylyltransferase subunit 1